MLTDELAALTNATPQEQAVIDFILKHPDFIASCTAKELAKASYTSPPTVVRLCQKLGLKGFPEFKMRFVVEQRSSANQLYAELSRPLVGKNLSENDVRLMIPKFYNRIIYETSNRINPSHLSLIAGKMRRAGSIDIYATGINYSIAQSAAFRFETLGLNVHVYDEGNIHLIERLTPSSNHISFLISHTGKNVGILKIAKILKERGLTSISITSSKNSGLSALTTLSIELFSTPSVDKLSLLSYPLSLNYIFDLLYVLLLSPGLDAMFLKTAKEFFKENEHTT